jgi:stage II sporulation protein AA (anti-sigma F factor antagonist)
MMRPFDMEILQDRAGDAVIVTPAGRLDSLSAPTLRNALAQLDAAGERRIVVDLGRVDYISSAGLGVLFALAKRMHEIDGALALCSLGAHVRHVFELAGYIPHFTVATTRDDALAHVNSGP